MFITRFGCTRSSTSTACSSMSPQTCTICSLWSLYKQTFMCESAWEVHCQNKWGFDTACVHKLESVGMISYSRICEQNAFNISIGKNVKYGHTDQEKKTFFSKDKINQGTESFWTASYRGDKKTFYKDETLPLVFQGIWLEIASCTFKSESEASYY